MRYLLPLLWCLYPALDLAGQEVVLKPLLGHEILDKNQTRSDLEAYFDKRLPRMPQVQSVAEWEKLADRLRANVLAKIVYRGAAAEWRDAKTKVEWLDTLPGGPGYRLRKVRYEALPGLWIPAILYEPDKLDGKVPVMMAVNGHDALGKAADYKQARCINLAKRGVIVLNVEWLGMGQLRTPGFEHATMNQLDLCGSSGVAPFYLSMRRGLDLLLAHKNADPDRVAVSGLSGGGWQTIFISSLDTRVTLANPVAGYSSFRTRARHVKDLGDSEQTPNDLATVLDYTHLTAMMAPRATLLTFNSKDNCCFESGYALPPLRDAALPIFRLYNREGNLRTHVNDDPGTHNFLVDNRQALYRMVGDHFFTADKTYKRDEIACNAELKTKDALLVPMPKDNLDFNKIALGLAKTLPRDAALPTKKAEAEKWQQRKRERLRDLVQAKEFPIKAEKIDTADSAGVNAIYWKLRMNDWTVPVVELKRGKPKGTTILFNDAGRTADVAHVERLLKEGQRVLAVDPYSFGEATPDHAYLYALLVAATGDRPLGIQASQIAALARWSLAEHKQPVHVTAVGPRSSLIVLVAAALETKAIGGIDLYATLGSLKEIIEKNRNVRAMPEAFCHGLLEQFDVRQIAALVAPRPVRFPEPSERVKAEIRGLPAWYKTLKSEK